MKFDRADGTYTSKEDYLQYRPLGVQNVKLNKVSNLYLHYFIRDKNSTNAVQCSPCY